MIIGNLKSLGVLVWWCIRAVISCPSLEAEMWLTRRAAV